MTMDKKEGVADISTDQPSSTLAPPATTPVRKRSKLACDTCHYRKIKCDVDKGIPCKNCERSSAQCTLVGPAMRPPRNISGSTSAAAAAAVAVAVATAAAANAHSGAGIISSTNLVDNEVDQLTVKDDQTQSFSNESGTTKTSSLLVRRASASGQLMRVDESSSGDTDTTDTSRGRRSLLSSSSSPTSLRALFNAGASATQSPTIAPSESAMQLTTHNSVDSLEGILGSQNGDRDVHKAVDSISSNTRTDYFDHPIAYSESSSSNTSTPSGAIMTNGMPHFGYTMDTLPSTVAHLISPLSSPLCHAQSASLPPTPFQLMTDRLPESIIASASMNGISPYPQGRPQFQTPTPHPRYGIARRASSSSYLPSSHSTENEIRIQQHDRRTSAPWTAYNHSQSLQFENRHVPQTQAQIGGNGVQNHQYGPTVHSIIRHHATTDDIQPYPTQSVLMRSNSTPAALRSPLKTLNRNRHSALPSRRSHAIPARQSLNLYASTDKVIQDLSLPQKLYRNSALPQRHVNNMSHLQFQLHLQQLQKSQQHGQRSQSLPRFQPDQSHRSPSQSSILQWQGYSAPQLRQQETEINFDLGVDNTHDVEMNIKSLPLGHSAPIGSDTSSDVIPADILSPLSTSSPTHASANDFQLFGNQIGRTLDLDFGLGEDANANSNIGGITQQDLLAQHHIHQPLSEDHTPKLQFAPGYGWRQDQGSDRTHGHARHQSASQVYPQQPVHLHPSAQQRVNFTRSLQDLTRYTALADQQHRPVNPTQFLTQDTAMPHAPTLDQNSSQDSFGAALAIDLNDHLRLLDDMDTMPEFGEFNDLSQTSILATNHSDKDTMIQSTSIPGHPDQPIVGSIPTPAINGHHRSILSSITNSHNHLLLDNGGINGTIGQSTEIHHFHGGPYVDTLSFLDLSGSFMAATPVTVPMNSAATSSSLPNASFLDQQNGRLYGGFIQNIQQQQQHQPLAHTLVHNPLALQHPQNLQQAPPQQHIIHHHHHHHHIH